MMRHSLLFGMIATLLGAADVEAAVSFNARDVSAYVSFTRSDFSDAVLTIDATTKIGDGSAGDRAFNFGTSSRLTSSTATTTGAVSLTDFAAAGGNISGTVHASGGGTFTFHNSYATDLTPGGEGPLVRYAAGVISALPVLELYLPIDGAGLVDEGGVFTIHASFPGNYSVRADDPDNGQPGQHVLFLDYAFDLPQNFVFDPASGRSIVSAIDARYSYPDSANFDAYIFGSASATPEPASWALLTGGFGAVGAAMRRRKVTVCRD